MKQIYGIDKEIGGDGATIQGNLGIQGNKLRLEFAAEYPLEKVVEPATELLDKTLDKLEKLIPGSWDKPIIDKIKAEYKEELVKILSEKVAPTLPSGGNNGVMAFEVDDVPVKGE